MARAGATRYLGGLLLIAALLWVAGDGRALHWGSGLRSRLLPPPETRWLEAFKEARTLSLSRENSELRGILELKASGLENGLAASLAGRDPKHWFSFVYLDKGARDGVAPNSAVVGPTGLMGVVDEVELGSCRVRLLSDPQLVVPVMTLSGGVTGLLFGFEPDRCLMRFVDKRAEVAEGELVVTSGLGGELTVGLPVGEVARELPTDDALTRTFEVALPRGRGKGMAALLIVGR